MPFIPNSKRTIFYRVWDLEDPKANIVLFHGIGEHSGLYHRFAYNMNAYGFRVFGIDHTAHGHTPGEFEEAYDVYSLAENGIKLLNLMKSQGDNLPLIVVGHSLGGITASLIMSSDEAPTIDGLVLTGTPFEPIEILNDLDSIVMSRDPMYLDELSVDPVVPKEEVNFAKLNEGLRSAQKEISENIYKWKFPSLFINGEADPVAPPSMTRKWLKYVSCGRLVEINEGCHDIINDSCHEIVANFISTFVTEVITKEVIAKEVIKS